MDQMQGKGYGNKTKDNLTCNVNKMGRRLCSQDSHATQENLQLMKGPSSKFGLDLSDLTIDYVWRGSDKPK